MWKVTLRQTVFSNNLLISILLVNVVKSCVNLVEVAADGPLCFAGFDREFVHALAGC
jgi:hypothetical protein